MAATEKRITNHSVVAFLRVFLKAIPNPWYIWGTMAFNTTANCSDPTYAFSTPDSLSTCFQAFASHDYLHDYGTYEAYNADYWYNGIKVNPNSTFGLVIEECIKQYCLQPNSALNGCGSKDEYPLSAPPDGFSASGCASVNTAMNQDISGPGVILTTISLKKIFRKDSLLLTGTYR